MINIVGTFNIVLRMRLPPLNAEPVIAGTINEVKVEITKPVISALANKFSEFYLSMERIATSRIIGETYPNKCVIMDEIMYDSSNHCEKSLLFSHAI